MYQKAMPDAVRRVLSPVASAVGVMDGDLRPFKVTFHYESGSGRTGIAVRTQQAVSERAICDEFDEAWEDDVLLRFRLTEESARGKAPAGSLMLLPARRVYRIFISPAGGEAQNAPPHERKES